MANQPASVEAIVNDEQVTLDLSPGAPLIVALREQLGLRGVRTACGVGECGACTVLVDGTPTRSCITPTDEVAGRRITTPEGLGGPDDPHAVQQAFIDMQAAQCGYCINGIIMNVVALEDRAHTLTDDDLASQLDETLCRCGTHPRVLQAARRFLGISEREGIDPPADVGSVPEDLICDRMTSCRVLRVDGPASDREEELPALIAEDPRIERWLALTEGGRIALFSGRSEIGQGVHQGLRQIASAQIGVAPELIDVCRPRTDASPDEAYTAGSRSMSSGGPAVAFAAMAFRRSLVARALHHLDTDPDEVDTPVIEMDGTIRAGAGTVSLSELAAGEPITGPIEATDQPRWDVPALGASLRRDDLAMRLTGAGAFVHDLTFPGMLYARAVLPPTYDAELVELDTTSVEQMPGIQRVVRSGRLILVLATSDAHAMRAVTVLESRARWEDPGLPFAGDAITTLRSLEAHPHVERADLGVDEGLRSGTLVGASYSKPYQAHGAMAPSCAVAFLEDDQMTVWSHTQGVYPLRRELAAFLDKPLDDVTVVHGLGPGCFGHNGADDAAGLAAFAAEHVPGTHVRFQMSSADEFGWEPYGSAMAVDLQASVDDDGGIRAWRHRIVTDAAVGRPRGDGDRLIAAWLREPSVARPWPGPHQGGARDGDPIYDMTPVEVVADHMEGPLRTASLRTLGSFMNIFAIESFMDELAEHVGQDPIQFRLRHLRDARARHVLEVAAQASDWDPHVGPSGRGQGIALCRYHGVAAYVAIVADVDVDVDTDRLAVRRVTMVVDAGTVINTEGLRQQLEGGVMQGLSRTFYEQLRATQSGVVSRDWSNYPVARFSDVPAMQTIILERPGSPPLGIGEASTPAVPAAIANAIDDALGIRLRDLPFTTDAIRDRLLDLSETEIQRVLVD